VRIVGVVPRGSKIVGGGAAERIEGLASDIVPGIWRRYSYVVNEVIEVGFDEALQTMKTLLRDEGILGGLSTGANVYAAMRVAEKLTKGVVVTIAPDTILRYPHLL